MAVIGQLGKDILKYADKTIIEKAEKLALNGYCPIFEVWGYKVSELTRMAFPYQSHEGQVDHKLQAKHYEKKLQPVNMSLIAIKDLNNNFLPWKEVVKMAKEFDLKDNLIELIGCDVITLEEVKRIMGMLQEVNDSAGGVVTEGAIFYGGKKYWKIKPNDVMVAHVTANKTRDRFRPCNS
jgi:hypothetical protein